MIGRSSGRFVAALTVFGTIQAILAVPPPPSNPPAAPPAATQRAAADRVGDKLRDQVRDFYMQALRCTHELLGSYKLRQTDEVVTAFRAGDLIPRKLGPMIEGKGAFSPTDALACRDFESMALILLEAAERLRSRAALRELLPQLERRFEKTPMFAERAALRKDLDSLKSKL